jgi:gluconate kinase
VVSVEDLKQRVVALSGKRCTPALLAVTGASGSGKTTVLEALRAELDPRLVPTLAFDSLGVPSDAEMIEGWESGRGWQKAMTWHWVQTAKNVFRTQPLVVLEGSFDPQYAIAACSANRMKIGVVALHVPDDVRRERLAKRGQPELATADMASWCRYLQEQTQQLGGHIVDATSSPEAIAQTLCAHAVTLLADVAIEASPPRRN